MRTILLLLSLAVLWLSTYEVGVQPAMPLLLDTSLPTQTGALINVPAGGDLQSAINLAQPGDTITLPAGATFTASNGGFVLTPKTGEGWIVIRTTNLSGIPAAENRVAPLHSMSMPRIVSPGVAPAILTSLGAAHYRLIGLEITTASPFSYGLVSLGSDTTVAPAAHEIILDRCYIHGSPTNETRRGVAVNGASLAVVDSYISDIHQSGNDSQAIAGWNGPGPFKIVNNYLEAAGENVMFGGGDPASAGMSPADIEVRGNYLRKPAEWIGASWSVKNLFELKDARRVLVTDNLLEGNWVNGQSGMSVLFTPRNQNGNAPWTQVCDVTFARNTLRAGAGGLNILGHDDLAPSGRTERIKVEGNRFEDIGRTELGGNARLIQLLDGPAYLTFTGNTFLHAAGVEGHALIIAGSPVEGFLFQGNTIHGYGIFGDNYGVGAAAVAQYLPGAVFGGNVWLAASWCPAGDSLTSAPGNNGLQFYPLSSPGRLLDTRPGTSPNACSQPNAPIAANTSRLQPARNFCGIPANAAAITGNVTTVASGGGFLTLYPSGAARPTAASTNYNPNEIVNNVFTVGLGADGNFNIYSLNSTDTVVDVTGYYAPPAAGGLYFHPLPAPVRLLETRAGLPQPVVGCVKPGAPLTGGADSLQTATTTCTGIPATALAIVGNATTVSPLGPGYLTLFPADAGRPLIASSNYDTNQVINGPFTTGLSAAGQFKVFTTTTTELVIDVLGYYSAEAADANGAGLLFTPLAHPVRLLETRAGQPVGCFKPGAPLNGNQIYVQTARGLCDGLTIPAAALGVVGNATVVAPLGGGFLTLWPSSAAKPTATTSNYNAGEIINRHFIVGLSNTDGAFNMFSFAKTDLVIDLTGYFAP